MKNIIDTTAEIGTRADDSRIQNPESNTAAVQQLNLCFATQFRPRRRNRRQQLLQSQAAFWFGTIRRVVDNAIEWKPAPPARPEQTALDLRRVTDVQLAK